MRPDALQAGGSAARSVRPLFHLASRLTAVALVAASAVVAKEAATANDAASAPLPLVAVAATAAPTRTPTADSPAAEPPQTPSAATDPDLRYFDGRPVRPVRTIRMRVTAYSPDEQSCGKWADGITASNKSVWTNAGKLVAADTSLLPLGSLVSVPGYDDGAIVPVLDRGGAIKGRRLDVLYPTHEAALQWGVQELDVVVWEYVDGPAGL